MQGGQRWKEVLAAVAVKCTDDEFWGPRRPDTDGLNGLKKVLKPVPSLLHKDEPDQLAKRFDLWGSSLVSTRMSVSQAHHLHTHLAGKPST